MSNAEVIQKIKELMGKADRVDIDPADPAIQDIVKSLREARLRLDLSKDKLAVDFPAAGKGIISIYRIGAARNDPIPAVVGAEREVAAPSPRPVPKRYQHTYRPTADVEAIEKVMADEASHIIQLIGPTGCGKTTLVHYLGRKTGRKVYQINCRGDMGSESFFGEKTIVVDQATGQNVISYQKGVLEQAMVEGLDETGNEVGKAAILFLDELPSCPAHIAQGLNRFMESDDPRRTIVLDQDGGRVVRSHSGLRVIVAGNTMGRGAHGAEAIHTAQMDALDFSLLSRVAVAFRMGYNREVERYILVEKVGDDRTSQLVIDFRDAIRGHIAAGKLTTPFSTRNIVNIADMYRIWKDLGRAVYHTVFEFLNPEEKVVYNETAMAVLGKDLLKLYTQPDVDYM